MHRNAYTLAALAAAAVPGFDPVDTQLLATPLEGRDLAGVLGEDGRRVVVTAPRSSAAGVDLTRDAALTEALAATNLAAVVPPIVGRVGLRDAGHAVVTAAPAGAPLMLDDLDDPALARALGAVLAQVHEVPQHVAESAGAEVFSAASLREGHRTAVERARIAGQLPAAVSQRWDAVLADDDLWDFTPRFTHQDLSEQAFFHAGGRITAFRDWAAARVGDPAQDLAWLVSALAPESFDALYGQYLAERHERPEARLLERAQVLGEFAVLEWLLHGMDVDDEEIIVDAQGMLADLEADIAEAARREAESAYEGLHGSHGEGQHFYDEGTHSPGETERDPVTEHDDARGTVDRPDAGHPEGSTRAER